MLVAKMRDATGSYDASFALMIGLAFLGLLTISFLPRKLAMSDVENQLLKS